MKVSIIIPIYNVESYIERCLLSVLNQTYENLEIILVDDCTPDKSIEKAREIVNGYPKCNHVIFSHHEHNRGLSAARNTGVDIAEGDYLYFLDSDDELPLNSIGLLVSSASEYSYPDIVVGDLEIINSMSDMSSLKLNSALAYYSDPKQVLQSFAHKSVPIIACNKLVKREYFMNNKLYFQEGIIHEDELWSFKVANSASNMSVVNNETYRYYINSNSITAITKPENIESCCLIAEYIKHKIDNKEVVELENSLILETLRNESIKSIYALNDRKLQYIFFKKLGKIKIRFRCDNINRLIMNIILTLPSWIGFRLLSLILKKR